MVSLNVTGAAHFVVLPANSSLPTVVDSQALTTQSAATLFSGYTVAASGDMAITSAYTNYSQAILVRMASVACSSSHLLVCQCLQYFCVPWTRCLGYGCNDLVTGCKARLQ